ncbi:hypothetical protein [Cyclobacterium sp.]|uniref:hypothetical protein n=1 Tax=Cyclobacterium sp. TaxID=1966343 RepID=UPI0019BD2FE7|nr:hypothetical protein [Cyclobacterium sp.]MBD3627563.1 hypothetical protein [Cyclobacterium sp.]
MIKTFTYSVLIGLLLLNGMGATLVQMDFLINRDRIAALFCINQDKPELACEGSCELSKRLEKTKEKETENNRMTLEEVHLVFIAPLHQEKVEQVSGMPLFDSKIGFPLGMINHFSAAGIFHPPKYNFSL